jgi:toxin YoeB
MKKVFADQAWEDYVYWQLQDRKILKRINELIKDTERSPYEGIGKPEPLKHSLAGFWSRRVNDEHRMVYRVEGGNLELAQLRFHYEE